jgi:hypothetical protein
MTKSIKSLRREAETLFLGLEPIVGIAIGENEEGPELVFLLKNESIKSMQSIHRWASKTKVPFRFVVTGNIRALTRL